MNNPLNTNELPALSDDEINAIWSAKDQPLQKSALSPFGMDRIRAIIAADRERQAGEADAQRDYMSELGFVLEERSNVWVVVDDCGGVAPASLNERVLWSSLMKAASLPAPQGAQADNTVTVLPDGSAFGVMSFPLPKDHWLYRERVYMDGSTEPVELPSPVCTHEDRDRVIAAVRYAVRGATDCGKEADFDPDALVQNAVYALCGPFTSLAAAPSPDGKAEQAEAPSVTEAQIDQLAHEHDLFDADFDSPALYRFLTAYDALRATHPTASNAGEREDLTVLLQKFADACIFGIDSDERKASKAIKDLFRAALSTQPPQGGQKPKTAEEMRPDFEWWWVTRSVFPALGTREAAAAWAAWVASGGYTAPDGWQLSDAPWGWEAVNSAPQPEQVAQDTVDAERYRWLREADPDEGPFIAEVLTNDWGKSNPCAVHQEAADKRIDAARARGDGGGL